MAKQEGYMTGKDAAYIKPKMIPDYELLGRDDSGGPDYQPYTAVFGDGGQVHGAKAHLSASGGVDDPKEGSEQLSKLSARNSDVDMEGGKSSKRKYAKD